MNRKLSIWVLSCILAMGLQAETIRVLRFVPVNGSESEVAQSSLQKVVFSRDSVMLISATNGEAAPMYKYDYQRILFTESSTPSAIEQPRERQPRAGKFIRNGQLYIRLDEQVFDAQGRRIN